VLNNADWFGAMTLLDFLRPRLFYEASEGIQRLQGINATTLGFIR
jgi:hypothetical protein